MRTAFFSKNTLIVIYCSGFLQGAREFIGNWTYRKGGLLLAVS